MSYIDKIWKNITDAVEIRKVALTQKVSFEIATIMYHGGQNDIDREKAEGILLALNANGISIKVAKNLEAALQQIGGIYRNTSRAAINSKISFHARRKYVDELDEYIRSNYFYGEKIREIMESGKTIDQAIAEFEKRVKKEMSENGLSELEALAKILCFGDNFKAKEFADSYLRKQAIKHDPVESIKRGMCTSDRYKHTTVHGIVLISETEEGLNSLISAVNYAFQHGQKDQMQLLEQEAAKRNLFIGDFLDSDKKTSLAYFASKFKYIYLVPGMSAEQNAQKIYHETTHFLDVSLGDVRKGEFLSPNSEVIEEILTILKEKIKFPVLRGMAYTKFPNVCAKKYSTNPKLNQKWLEEIKMDNPHASPEDIQLFWQQKVLYERKKHKALMHCLMDIYDGLTNGAIYKHFNYGHGKEYYSAPENIAIEFLAQIGTIYNCGGVDVLNYEFGEEITQKIMMMYEQFLKRNLTTEPEITDVVETQQSSVKR